MNYDEKIQNLTQQIAAASRDVIIQDRVLGQARERVAELQGRINMLVELQQESLKIDPDGKVGEGKKHPGSSPAGRSKQPKEPYTYQKEMARHAKGVKPGPKPKPEKKRAQFRYPSGLRNFCIKNIDKMTNQELVEAANEEFDLDMDYVRLASYISYNNIKRSKEVKKEQRVLPPEDDY